MKKKILATAATLFGISSATAADLPIKKAEPTPTPPSWQGLYVGLNAGGIWANNNKINNTNSWTEQSNVAYGATAAWLSGTVPASGTAAFLGGGQIGYNWQIGKISKLNLLAGVETDIQGIAPGGSTGSNSFYTAIPPYNISGNNALIYRSASNSQSYIGTVRGRAGLLLTPTILLYGTGGLAYGGANVSLNNLAAWPTGSQSGSNSYSNTQVGWAAGGGFEWVFRQNWSLKAEYLYYDIGKASGTVYNFGTINGGAPVLASITQYSTRFNGNILRAGVNYHLNWGPTPVVAKF